MTSSAGPNSIRQAISRIGDFLPSEDWIVIGWVIAIKTLLFVIGVKSYPMLWDKYAPTPNRWFEPWDQWDFGHYQKIAEFGYEASDGSLALPAVPVPPPVGRLHQWKLSCCRTYRLWHRFDCRGRTVAQV